MNQKNNRFVRFGWLMLFFVFAIPTIIYGQTSLPPAAQEALDKGIIAAKLPDYPLAIRYFEEARKIAPDASITYFYLGLAESKIPGRELRAICWFSAFLAADPNSPKAASVKVELQKLEIISQSNLSRLIKMLQDARIDKNFWMSNIASLWAKSGDFSQALKIAETLSPSEKDSELREIATIQASLGDLSGALKTIQIIKNTDNQMSGYLFIVDALIYIKDFDNAIKVAEMVQDADKKNASLKTIAEYQAKQKSISPLTANEWIQKINQLGDNYFLDLAGYLKTLPTNNAQEMFNELYKSASGMVFWQSEIVIALKRKPTEQPK